MFEFADKYRGAYSNSLKSFVCLFYCDYSGFQVPLLWVPNNFAIFLIVFDVWVLINVDIDLGDLFLLK